MSNQRTISDNQLTENKFVLVRGRVKFCRLIKRIEGEELEKDKVRKTQIGMSPVTVPYTTIEITNPRIVPLSPDGQLSIEEQYVQERFWKSNNDPANGPLHYSINNKSPFPNQFYQAKPGQPTVGDQIYPTAELANDLDVILVLRVFQPKNYPRKGLTLHSVILQEPIRYYVGANNAALAAAGVILNSAPKPETEQHAAAPADTAEAAPAAQVSAPAPGTAFATAPAQTPAQAVHDAPPVGAAPAPWTCPNCGTLVAANMQFCGSCGTKKADAQPATMGGGNPYAAEAQAADAGHSGIRYDPNSTARDY